jgi:adenylate kinase
MVMDCKQQHKMVFLGAPGAGKGTQAKRISECLGIPQISTGDILRSEIKNQSNIGMSAAEFITNGSLVPDHIVIQIVKKRLQKDDCNNGYILDGFPRNLEQARAMDRENIDLSKVIVFDADDDVLLRRLSGRRVCSRCNAMFHLVYKPPEEAGVCDFCKSELITRKDDEPETIAHRIMVYRKQTAPLIEYYQNHSSITCLRIDAGKTQYDTPDIVLKRLLQVLAEECSG